MNDTEIKANDLDHAAWCRYVEETNHATRIALCDSDAVGAFKVYRHPVAAALAEKDATIALQQTEIESWHKAYATSQLSLTLAAIEAWECEIERLRIDAERLRADLKAEGV